MKAAEPGKGRDGLDRRSFLTAGVAGAVAASSLRSARAQDLDANLDAELEAELRGPIEDGPILPCAVMWSMLPDDIDPEARVAMAARCGFDGIEAPPMDDLDEARRIGELAVAAEVPVHCIIYGGWHALLSDPDPSKAAQGKEDLAQAMRTANAMGADTVLLVPGRVTPTVRYIECYERTQERIPDLFPLAEELGVVIAVENVWNDFLLSPIEFARYVDEFNSPWLQAYFDCANIVAYGHPQDWIRTLGHRIRRVHYKDFHRDTREWTKLGEGTIDWQAVHEAFIDVGFTGWCTAELPGGDEAYLTEVRRRMNAISVGGTGVDTA